MTCNGYKSNRENSVAILAVVEIDIKFLRSCCVHESAGKVRQRRGRQGSSPTKRKAHRQFVQEQIEKSPEFAAEYSKVQLEKSFAVALAMLREERGITQQQLADAAGLRQPMLARYENGQSP